MGWQVDQLLGGTEQFTVSPKEIRAIHRLQDTAVSHRPANSASFVKLPDWLQQIVKEGAPKGARSEAAFKACLWMIRYGWSEEAIREIFAAYPNGIGEKYAESGDRWLAVTLRAAREAA